MTSNVSVYVHVCVCECVYCVHAFSYIGQTQDIIKPMLSSLSDEERQQLMIAQALFLVSLPVAFNVV